MIRQFNFFKGLLMYYCYGISDMGVARQKNEDAFLIGKIIMQQRAELESALTVPFIVAVADGVGGENSGEIASRLCLQLLELDFENPLGTKQCIKEKLLQIHLALREYGFAHEQSLNMQTTLCALVLDGEDTAYSINVGDSRMYRLRGGKLKQLTADQSLVQLLYDNGEITNEEKQFHEKRNIILPALGNIAVAPAPSIKKIGAVSKDDTILICSDGLTDYSPDDEIETVLNENFSDPRKALPALIKLAIDRGSRDNITALILTNR